MSQSILNDRPSTNLPLDAQVKYLSLQAELDLLLQKVRTNQAKTEPKA
jgi:hypothetical protein